MAAALVKVYGIPTFAIKAKTARPITSTFIPLSTPIRISRWMTAPTWFPNSIPHRAAQASEIDRLDRRNDHRCHPLARHGKGRGLQFPVVAVNDAKTKHLFDNRYGTGQSTMDGIIRATDVLVAGAVVVVAGYGWCGRGVAIAGQGFGRTGYCHRSRPHEGLGSGHGRVRRDAHREAAPIGDVFVTLTGDKHVIRREHFAKMKDGAIVANSGHFDVELDLAGLRSYPEAAHHAATSFRNTPEEWRKSVRIWARVA